MSRATLAIKPRGRHLLTVALVVCATLGAGALLVAPALAAAAEGLPPLIDPVGPSELPSQCPLGYSARAAPESAAPESAAPESEPSALADAVAMLAELPLPSGSSESSADPSEAGSLLAGPGYGPPATPNAVDEHAWWLVPVTPTETLAYICAHLPPGTKPP
jgi:hypothetical protein